MFWADVLTLCVLLGTHPWFLCKYSEGYKSVMGKKRLKLEVAMLDHRNEVLKLSSRPGSGGRYSILNQEVFKLFTMVLAFLCNMGKKSLSG